MILRKYPFLASQSWLWIEKYLFLEEEESWVNMSLNPDLSTYWRPQANFCISLYHSYLC